MKPLPRWLLRSSDGWFNISVPDLLDECGVPNTLENREAVIIVAREIVAEIFPDARCVVDRTGGRN